MSAADLLWGKRSVTFASRLCLASADRMANNLGASGQLRSNPVQQLFNDCRGITAHLELHWDHSMTPTGMRALGLPTGDPLIDGESEDSGRERVLVGTQI